MKQPFKLPLTLALAISGANAYALGLGTIQVKSGLNQPLNAEIPVLASTPGEAEGLIVQLASEEDFARVGLNRVRMDSPLEFSIGKDSRGGTVIRITTKDAIREPFLDFLIQANWPNGRLLREYTVLLDPPVMAPAMKGTPALVSATPEPERAATQPLPKKPSVTPSSSASATTPAAKATSAPIKSINGNEYGPVAAGETLSAIARHAVGDDNVSVNQMMLALLKQNPNAFYKNNINALKRGAILRIPSADEVQSVSTAREAAAQVRAQVDEWQGIAKKPTLINDAALATTTAPASSSTPTKGTKTTSGRLELVPPRANNESQAATDRPGAGNDTGKTTNSAELKAELAHTKETLTSREQETGELKSRVKELEELKNKNNHLITLKDSEIAELQQKLKELKESQTQKTEMTTAPLASNNETSAPTIANPPASTEPAVAITTTPAPTTATSVPPDQSPAPVASTAAKPAAASPTPAKLTPAAPPTAPLSDAWYLRPWALGAAAIAALLILIAGLGLRKRSAPTQRRSVSDAFDASVFPTDIGAEEQALLEQLQENPNDASLHLELLSLYYADQDAEKFEAAAEEMYALIADPNQPEWQQVKAMGEELAPHNPLFGGTQDLSHYAEEAGSDSEYEPKMTNVIDNPSVEDTRFDFDFAVADESTKTNSTFAEDLPATKDGDFNFELPTFEFTNPSAESDSSPPASHIEPIPNQSSTDDEFLANEDAIGTKLDLAKAYFDMGDTEGARSMLEEVLAEGNETQQDEARKLMADFK